MDSNNTTGTYDHSVQESSWIFIPIISLISLWIIIANSMIIAAPRFHRPLRNNAYIFISNLAIADLLTAFMVLAAFIMLLYRTSRQNEIDTNNLTYYIYCKTELFFLIFPIDVSMWSLLLICIDRFFAVVSPLRIHPLFTRGLSAALCMTIWTVAFLRTGLLYFLDKNSDLECSIADVLPCYAHFLAGPFWVILLTMYILYLHIFITIHRRGKDLPKQTTEYLNHASQLESKLIKMLFITMGVFSLCWIPTMAMFHLAVELKITAQTLRYMYMIGYFNSGMNFFIYVARSDKYKAAFRKICCCFVQDNSDGLSNTCTLSTKFMFCQTREDVSIQDNTTIEVTVKQNCAS